MAKYSSKPQTTDAAIEKVYDRVSHIGSLQERIESLPEEIRAKLGDVKFTDDSIVLNAAPVGAITFNVVERTAPTRVALAAENSPVPVTMSIDLTANGDSATDIVTTIDIDIPPMLRPMVGGKLQEAANKLGELVGQINYNA